MPGSSLREGDLDTDLEALRQSVLTARRDPESTVAALAAERRGQPTGSWDVVDRLGGLKDLELGSEALQLGLGAREVLVNGIGPTFEAAARSSSVLDTASAGQLAEAAALWQNVDGFIRMSSGSGAFDPGSLPPDQRQTLAEIAGVEDFEALPDVIAETAERTARLVTELLDGSLYARQTGLAQPAPER